MGSWLTFAAEVAVMCLLARSARATDGRVRLTESAGVKGAVIRLSDLFPGAAPAILRQAGEGIELGSAPQPGSVRTFERGQIMQSLGGATILREISIPARVVIRREGWPIPASAILAAIRDFLGARGEATNELPADMKLDWPTGLTTAEENPALQVAGARWDNGHHRLQIRIRCSQRSICGSFLVSAALPKNPDLQLGSSGSPARLRLTGVPSQFARRQLKEPVIAKEGEVAKLNIESIGMRISFPVVCLQPGALSQEIRVRKVGGARVFRARVLSRGELQAIF